MKRTLFIGGTLVVVVFVAVFLYGAIQGDFSGLLYGGVKNNCGVLQSPVDIREVTSVLYPGQYRGGNYKPHGGFRFDGLKDNAVDVRAPMDAILVSAGGNILESGEAQYALLFETSCGLDYMFGHLLTLTPKFQKVFDGLTLKAGNVQTFQTHLDITVQTGEVLATEVGSKKAGGVPNVSFDFGVSDRRVKNEISKTDAGWRAEHHGSGRYQAEHGVCWLDLLPADDSLFLKKLPGGDWERGKQSDYCF